MYMLKLLIIGILIQYSLSENSEGSDGSLQTIEGSIKIDDAGVLISSEVMVVLDGGRYCGYVTSTGEFTISNVPAGSYLVEALSPNYEFDSVRVDISSKSGKIRARRVNLLKTASVSQVPYPLMFKIEKQALFFEKRESWSLLQTLKNPMVLILVAPLVLMMIVPRLLKSMDPDYQKDVQESMNVFQQPGSSMPSIEEMFTNMFSGSGSGSRSQVKKNMKKPKPNN